MVNAQSYQVLTLLQLQPGLTQDPLDAEGLMVDQPKATLQDLVICDDLCSI